MALSLFFMIDIMLVTKPAKPKAAMAKVIIGINDSILSQIKTIKAMLNPTDNLPNLFLGSKVIFMLVISLQKYAISSFSICKVQDIKINLL